MPSGVTVGLTLNEAQHAALKAHLFPGDGLEAVAFLLCGQRAGDRRTRLVAREVFTVPYSACEVRTDRRVTWPTDVILPLLERAESFGGTLVKVHSHPGGYPAFSEVDDESDQRLLPSMRDWFDDDRPHGSAVMLPDGRMFGRTVGADRAMLPLAQINVAGDDLLFWRDGDSGGRAVPGFAASHAQAFGEGTFDLLRRLSVAVIGCSGTGSPVIEQLARLGVGELVIVDDDTVEERNLNRILNATMADAEKARTKVAVIAGSVERMGTGTRVFALERSLWSPEAIEAVAQCDIVFGCMDTIDGRFLLNTLATYYQLPYFDLGVRIHAVREGPRQGEIVEACGSVHYLTPGGSSLVSRGLFSLDDVRAAGLARTDPEAHAQQIADGYISGIAVRRPAVISLNMLIASLAVNELLSRLHPFRDDPNEAFAHIEVSLGEMAMFRDPKPGACPVFRGDVGKGDKWPLLDMPELSWRTA
jgi:hypothetical protein